jgi:molybdate transport system substrate-binding protein
MKHSLILLLLMFLFPSLLRAEDALIAVATNFTVVAEALETAFESSTDHRITLASGSTGKLYAQILNGAPYDALLAADELRPTLLEASTFGVAGTRFTYATGRLALWSADKTMMLADINSSLVQPRVRHIAMANPDLAPYGFAAAETLQALGLNVRLQGLLVQGENIGQAYALIATGNAELGFVAMSYVLSERRAKGSYVEVPAKLHTPLRQDALLLRHGANNVAAQAFLDFLHGDAAKALLKARGYD